MYDPDPLVEALKIKRTEQQDAQEFSKLFLTLLDWEFKKQGKRAESEGGGESKVARIVEEQVRARLLALSRSRLDSETQVLIRADLRARSSRAR